MDFFEGLIDPYKRILKGTGTLGRILSDQLFPTARGYSGGEDNRRSADIRRPVDNSAGIDVDASNPGRGFGTIDNGPSRGFGSVEKVNPLEELRKLLDERYSGNPVDTSFLQGALDSQLGSINDARNQAQGDFKTSDANVKAMHDAFRNDVLGQAGGIKAQNQEYQGDIRDVFDDTMKDNAARQAANRAANEEMYQRLGIAPAAAAPDLVGQAIEQGNQKATDSRNSRLSEALTLGNNELTRNTATANAIGNDALARRSELNGRLQEILGSLGNKEADLRSNFFQAQGDAAKENEQRQYERFIRDRDWNMNRYNQELDRQSQIAQQNSGRLSGFDALNAQTDPQVSQAVTDVLANNPDIDIRNPNQILVKLKSDPRYAGLNPDQVFRYLTQYNNLGTEKFSY